MKIIGITGGVGAGKTQILEYLNNKYGATICMADEVGKKLQKKGTECFDEIVAHFGEKILDEKGELDRTKLSDIVFADRVELSVLNGIVHPKVKEEIHAYLKKALAGDGLTPDRLTEEELAEVETLRRDKYATWEWTYGRSPKYSMTNRHRWDGGTLEAHLQVEKGTITGVVFYGDFLSLQPLDPVTEALLGCPFRREDVSVVLERFPLEQYFGTITRDEILDTLFYAGAEDTPL